MKYLVYLFVTIITSFYLFPFQFTFMQGVNTKMGLAVLGLFILLINKANKKEEFLDKRFAHLSVLAMIVSFIGFVAITLNDTSDYTYTSYIMSMWVWFVGAYTVTTLIRVIHGNISVNLIANYLIAACVLQCIVALLVEHYAAIDEFVASLVYGQAVDSERMSGFGAGLDPAGIRFAAVLVILGCISISPNRLKEAGWTTGFYLLAFAIISIVGNMISRTTTVGTLIAIIYWITESVRNKNSYIWYNKFWMWVLLYISFVVVLCTFLYHTNLDFRENIRFGFEGFFSLIEKGEWKVSSNEILKNMLVFPNNIKTWLIGDGYIIDPNEVDPYYVGPQWKGYYMGTDIGYLRFIFYFGLIGLVCFCMFFIYAAWCCMEKYKTYKTLFMLLLMSNFIIWFKVSTDIFCVFALFLSVPQYYLRQEKKGAYEQSIPIPS